MLFPSKWSIIWWGACIESKKSPVIVSIQSRPSAQHFARMGFRVLSYSEVPFIDGVRFMSSRFGNCYQAWTCSTGHDDASVCLLWMDVRIGVCGKNPMIVFTVSKYNQGVVWCSWGWDEQGGVFSSVRPRDVCSGLDGAGDHAVRRVWKLRRHGRYLASRRVRTRSSLRETDLQDTSSSGQKLGSLCGSDGWKLSWSARRINARFSLFTKRYFFRQQYYSLGSLQSMLQPVISLDIFADER